MVESRTRSDGLFPALIRTLTVSTETIIRQEVEMAVRDEDDREIQKLLSDSGVLKELLSSDGVMRISDRLNDIRGGLSWWVFRKKDKDGGTYTLFGS